MLVGEDNGSDDEAEDEEAPGGDGESMERYLEECICGLKPITDLSSASLFCFRHAWLLTLVSCRPLLVSIENERGFSVANPTFSHDCILLYCPRIADKLRNYEKESRMIVDNMKKTLVEAGVKFDEAASMDKLVQSDLSASRLRRRVRRRSVKNRRQREAQKSSCAAQY